MSKINSQLSSLLGRVFETHEEPSTTQEKHLSKTFLSTNRRISRNGDNISFLIDLSGSQRDHPKGPSYTDRLQPTKRYTTQEADLTSRKTQRRRYERLSTEDELDSQPQNLQKSYIAPSKGRSTTNSVSSCIDSSRESSAVVTTSLREQVLKRQNTRLRQENQKLKEELAALKNTLSKVDQHRYEKLQESYRLLENSSIMLTNQARDLQRKLHYGSYELEMIKDINNRLEKRIQGLVCENSQLAGSLEAAMMKVHELETVENRLKQVYGQFCLLQKRVERDDNEWEEQKQIWLYEKEYYKQIIRKLEFQVDQSMAN